MIGYHERELEEIPGGSELGLGCSNPVISNCAINLVPDKRQAFPEAFRVLKPGGK